MMMRLLSFVFSLALLVSLQPTRCQAEFLLSQQQFQEISGTMKRCLTASYFNGEQNADCYRDVANAKSFGMLNVAASWLSTWWNTIKTGNSLKGANMFHRQTDGMFIEGEDLFKLKSDPHFGSEGWCALSKANRSQIIATFTVFYYHWHHAWTAGHVLKQDTFVMESSCTANQRVQVCRVGAFNAFKAYKYPIADVDTGNIKIDGEAESGEVASSALLRDLVQCGGANDFQTLQTDNERATINERRAKLKAKFKGAVNAVMAINKLKGGIKQGAPPSTSL